MSFVLKKFTVDETAETRVDIQGRNGGLISWLLNVMGLGATTTLACTAEYVEFRSASLAGFESVRVPANAVTGVVFGLKKPIASFFLAALFLVLAIIGFISPLILLSGFIDTSELELPEQVWLIGFIPLLLSLIFVISYFLTKMFYIGFENGGDKKYMIAFKKSVIEGVSVDTGKVSAAADVINRLVREARRSRKTME